MIRKNSLKMFLMSVMICIFAMATGMIAEANEVIYITTQDDMQKLQYAEPGDTFVLTQDIDMLSYGLWDSIDDVNGIEIDGNSHKISNLTSVTGGLFNYINESYIHDLVLENVNIVAYDSVCIGAIANTAYGSTFKRCIISGEIKTGDNGETFYDCVKYVGGIGGSVEFDSCIDECVNMSSVKIAATSQRYRGDARLYAGGIAGFLTDSEITNCHNSGYIRVADSYERRGGRIAGIFYAGGISGKVIYSKVGMCVNNGEVDSVGGFVYEHNPEIFQKGGIAGVVDETSYLYNSYSECSAIGKSDVNFPSVRTLGTTGKKADYQGLNWSIWSIEKGINQGIPFLNINKKYYKIPKVFANMKSGKYSKAITVSLKNSVPNAKIYYTTDGSTPTLQSKVYKKSIKIKKSCKLKAIAYLDGYKKSNVVTYSYKIRK